MIRFFTGIDALRQHVRDDVRMHGIITDGGQAPNVVPDFAAANFMLRSRNREYLRTEVVEQVQHVAEGAARMTGAELEILPLYPLYENVRPNVTLAKAALAHAKALGMDLEESGAGSGGSGASTDSGNVSQVIPTYTVSFAVSQQPVAIHSRALTEAAQSEFALNVAIDVAKALALTACDLLDEPQLRVAARQEFEERGRHLEHKA